MTDQSLRRTDELLTELIELVETARNLPMSSSCVLPRERVLDMLDGLREVMPPEIDAARRVLAARDRTLHDADEAAAATRAKAGAEGDAIIADAEHRSSRVIHDAEVKADEIVEGGQQEHARLVSATTVHRAASEAAEHLRGHAERYVAELREEAEQYRDSVRGEADRYDADTRTAAERYAVKLAADVEQYADRTLAEMADALQRASVTAAQGRSALAQRRGKPVGANQSAQVDRSPSAPRSAPPHPNATDGVEPVYDEYEDPSLSA